MGDIKTLIPSVPGDTNQTLYNYHTELQTMKNSIWIRFEKSKITTFYKHNIGRLNTLIDKMNALTKKYYVFDEEDKLKLNKEGDNVLPILREGLTQADYQKEYNELMTEKVVIKFV